MLALSIDEWKEISVQDKIVQEKFKIVTPGLQKAYERPRSLQTSASKPKKFFFLFAWQQITKGDVI